MTELRVLVALWDHTMLPVTRHRWIHPALTPAGKAGTWFTYPGGMEGWVDLGALITPRLGVEPIACCCRWEAQRPNHSTTNTQYTHYHRFHAMSSNNKNHWYYILLSSCYHWYHTRISSQTLSLVSQRGIKTTHQCQYHEIHQQSTTKLTEQGRPVIILCDNDETIRTPTSRAGIGVKCL